MPKVIVPIGMGDGSSQPPLPETPRFIGDTGVSSNESATAGADADVNANAGANADADANAQQERVAPSQPKTNTKSVEFNENAIQSARRFLKLLDNTKIPQTLTKVLQCLTKAGGIYNYLF